MISFIWPPGDSMLEGTGGSETFTAGHVRELLRRGIKAQVVTVGHVLKKGRKDFVDLPFLSLVDASGISELSGTVVFVNRAYPVPTKNKSAIILHSYTPGLERQEVMKQEIAGKVVMATSIFNAQQWALLLDIPYSRIHIVLPFADPIFGSLKRSKQATKNRIVFAGRFHPDKGIYTILEMMHETKMRKNGYKVSLVAAGQHTEAGRLIAKMLNKYPYAKLLSARRSVLSMAELFSQNDIVLVPSVFQEPFGMISIEAQHAGCRVVASNIGGIPETNCGLLSLVEPRSPRALSTGIDQAVALGPATKKEREFAKSHFSLTSSVDSLLEALHI